jgi:hypothetical protein
MGFRTTIYMNQRAEAVLKRLSKATGRGASSLLSEALMRGEDKILAEHKKLERLAVTLRKQVAAAIRTETKMIKRRKKS